MYVAGFLLFGQKEVKELKQRHAELCENFSNSTLLMPEQQLSRVRANAVETQHNRGLLLCKISLMPLM